jgi:hypothetical protein
MSKWNPHPNPPVDNTPSVRTLAIIIKDENGTPVEGVNVIVVSRFDGFTNVDGYLAFNDFPSAFQSIRVQYSKDGYENKDENHIIPATNYDLNLTLAKVNVIKPVHVAIVDTHYETLDGVIYPREATAFQFFKDFCLNPVQFDTFSSDARGVLKVNLLNVLGMFNGGLGEFSPHNIPDYFGWLEKFCSKTYDLGWLIEFTVFADAQNIFTDRQSIFNHANSARGILIKWPHVLIRICNEPYKNLPDFITVTDLHNVFMGCPNYGNGETNTDDQAYEPVGTEVTNHPFRTSDFMRKAKNSLELRWKYKIPIRDNECIRPDQALIVLDLNVENTRRGMEEFGAVGKMYGIPQCLHADSLKFGKIPVGLDLDFLLCQVKGWDTCPSGFENGDYFNPHTVQPCPVKDSDKCMRIYGSTVGDKAIAIVLQPQETFQLEANDGWEVVSNERNLYYELRKK